LHAVRHNETLGPSEIEAAHVSLSVSEPRAGSTLLFALLCLVWGSTWLSLKVGVAAVPPLTFSAIRFLLAAIPLLGWAVVRGRFRVPVATVAPGAVLMIALNYGLMAWGIVRVSSGIASVINLSTVPAATLVLAVAYRQARWSAASVAAVLIGGAGLTVLFAPRFGAADAGGMGAIAFGAGAYAWGGILTKQQPVADPVALAGWQSLFGGALLAAAALLLEPVDEATFSALLTPAAVANLAFLVVAGSVIGGSVYLMLLARWSAAQVSAYAFVCPLIALAEGAVLAGEVPSPAELGAALLLMLATGLVLAAQTRRSR
jgi:drug/metabolite transporter (DMT)-like permease